jgi:hypothetical protein
VDDVCRAGNAGGGAEDTGDLGFLATFAGEAGEVAAGDVGFAAGGGGDDEAVLGAFADEPVEVLVGVEGMCRRVVGLSGLLWTQRVGLPTSRKAYLRHGATKPGA